VFGKITVMFKVVGTMSIALIKLVKLNGDEEY